MVRHTSALLAGAVGEALCGMASDVVETRPGHWALTLVNGCTTPVRARLAGRWFALSTAAPLAPQRTDPEWLAFNARLSGPVRAARAMTWSTARLHAEASLPTDMDVTRTVAETCVDLIHAADELEDDSCHDSAIRALEPAPHSSAEEVELSCRELQYSCTRSDSGQLLIDLPTRGTPCVARLVGTSRAIEHLVVEFGTSSPTSKVSQLAVARLLMALSASVRLVKAFTFKRDDTSVTALGASLSGRETDAVERAVSALATACVLASREVDALSDEGLARRYLHLTERHITHSRPEQEEPTCQLQL